jgi:hypothetical protein
MTPVLIGTYRKRQHIETCLQSADAHLRGVSEIIFIDDSGDPEHSAWLAQYGKVVETGARGYTTAMKHLCAAAEGRQCFILEEDFTFLTDVHIDQLADILYHRPYLAQVALLRGPHFPIEHQHGGVIEALKAKGHQFCDVAGVIEHTATFTANPSLWRAHVFALGWPTAQWSEEVKGRQLVAAGYRFGYLPGIRVEHHGTRDGHGY